MFDTAYIAYLDKVGQWAGDNGMRFSKVKCQVLHFSHKTSLQCYGLGTEWLENFPMVKNLGVLLDNS